LPPRPPRSAQHVPLPAAAGGRPPFPLPSGLPPPVLPSAHPAQPGSHQRPEGSREASAAVGGVRVSKGRWRRRRAGRGGAASPTTAHPGARSPGARRLASAASPSPGLACSAASARPGAVRASAALGSPGAAGSGVSGAPARGAAGLSPRRSARMEQPGSALARVPACRYPAVPCGASISSAETP
ncbi:PREDICTED: translation initiation factor IF-2-like, partial [Chinchilla lanigera]|uniref:translation initiation factor IF-2-like n=1 Tax=Chinchilla lanigera TaxID=34839 RepID=UPI000696684E